MAQNPRRVSRPCIQRLCQLAEIDEKVYKLTPTKKLKYVYLCAAPPRKRTGTDVMSERAILKSSYVSDPSFTSSAYENSGGLIRRGAKTNKY